MSACCSPGRDAGENSAEPRSSTGPVAVSRNDAATTAFVELSGGAFVIGTTDELAYPADGETPSEVTVASFALAATAVTNDEFRRFIEATGHLTDAERFEWSFVFGGLLPDDFEDTRGAVGAEWWRQVFGATWDHPEGPHSNVADRGNHPVVHVSWNDAIAYCAWSGTRLATEAEWEFAARAGTNTTWPWGNDLEPGGVHMMNVFQGQFPGSNTVDDGWAGTCPVNAFDVNPYGFHNMLGNVWEWTADAFSPTERHQPARLDAAILMKGGSYLCHESYCRRYRPSARMGSSADSSSGNVGFRVAQLEPDDR